MLQQKYNKTVQVQVCLLYTSDAADEEDSVDLGGRRICKKRHQKWCSPDVIKDVLNK